MKERDLKLTLSPEQNNAKELLAKWFVSKDAKTKPFVVQGYAGTGKTTMMKSATDYLNITSRTLFGAYTGKAALVMNRTGVNAHTIHSLIYKPVKPDEVEIKGLRKKLKEATGEKKKSSLSQEIKEKDRITFEINYDSRLQHASLIVLDECSMINDEMLSDLQSFKVPIVALGDKGQLPPIEGAGALFKNGANAQLTQIHRQAKGSPIIMMSIRARNMVPIPKCSEGTAKHIDRSSMSPFGLTKADQILTGKNVTRRNINKYIRQQKGFTDPYPVVGEKVICLRNDYPKGLFNGLLAQVVKVGKLYDDYIELSMTSEDFEDNKLRHFNVLRAHFDAYTNEDAFKGLSWWDRQKANEFDFGYAITVHKSQGSQWDNVLIYDDKMCVWNKRDRAQWLYTGITRAAKTLTLVDASK